MNGWRELKGFQYPVRVSRDGVLEKYIAGRWKRPRIQETRCGDAMVSLRRTGMGYNQNLPLARLIAGAFLKGLRPDLCVIHLNGDKRDNRAENLRIITYHEAGKRGGRMRPGRPVFVTDGAGRRKESYRTIRAAAKAYGVSEYRMANWCRGRGTGNPYRGTEWRFSYHGGGLAGN